MSDTIDYSKNDISALVTNKVVLDGINNITVEQLVKLLPFSRRTFFRVFECKEDLFFEIYKNIISILSYEVNTRQKTIKCKDRREAIKEGINDIIEVFIEHDRYIRFIIEFDALEIKSQSVSRDYDEFYMTMNFIYEYLKNIYKDSTYNQDTLLEMSILILETIYGLVYRYSITKSSNYKVGINVNHINLISDGLVSIIMDFEG